MFAYPGFCNPEANLPSTSISSIQSSKSVFLSNAWPTYLTFSHAWILVVAKRSRTLSSFIRTGAARYLVSSEFGELSCAFFKAVKTHRYESVWLSPSHPYFRSRAFFDLRCISMVWNGTFLRWSAKDNEKSKSLVESCLRILMRFLSLKKCMAECFLVLSSQGAARYRAAFVLRRLVMCVFQGRQNASVWNHFVVAQPSALPEPRVFWFEVY